MNQINVLQSILKKPMKDESYLNKIKSQDPYCEFLGRKNQSIFYSKKYIEIVSTSFDKYKINKLTLIFSVIFWQEIYVYKFMAHPVGKSPPFI